MSKGKIIAVVSGKGGVGKTTCSANIAVGLSDFGKSVAVLDFDIGQSNLDLILGIENRVIFNIIDVFSQKTTIDKALVKVKHTENLFFLGSAQDKDKNDLKSSEIKKILNYLKRRFDYVIIDSPAGIESGFNHAIEYADSAIIVVNPEVSSIRDADRAIGLLDAKSKKDISKGLIINRVQDDMIKDGRMLSIENINDILDIPILGLVKEDSIILTSSNLGYPAIKNKKSIAGKGFYKIAALIAGVKIKKTFSILSLFGSRD